MPAKPQISKQQALDFVANPRAYVAYRWPSMKLYAKQVEIMESVRDNVVTLSHAANEMGKCVAYGESIVLADGRVVLAESLIGRYFALPGFPTQVPRLAHAFDNGMQPVYRITTDSGRKIVRTENHPLWAADLARRNGIWPKDIGWRPLSDLKPGMAVAVTTNMRVTGGRKADEDQVALLGYLLGDGGTTRAVEFSQAEGQAKDEFRSIVKRLGGECCDRDEITIYVRAVGGKAFAKGSNPVLNLVREWGLLGTLSKHKRFPAWAWELPNDQLAILLNRLFSCDGWAHSTSAKGSPSNNEIGITSASEGMLRDVHLALLRLGINGIIRQRSFAYEQGGKRFVAWTLAIRNAREIERFASLVGIKGKEEAVAKCVAVAASRSVAHMHKWRTREAPDGFHWDRVKSIEYVGLYPTVGIEVDQDHAYVTTFAEHNTRGAALTALWFFDTRSPVKVVTSSSSQNQLKNILWREIGALIQSAANPPNWNVQSLLIEKFVPGGKQGEVQSDEYIIGYVTKTIESFQGHHLDEAGGIPRVLFIFDEASAIPNQFFEAAESQFHRALVVGNPLSCGNFFYTQSMAGDQAHPSGDGLMRKVIHIDGSRDSPNVQAGRRWVEEKRPGQPPTIIPGIFSWKRYLERLQSWPEDKLRTRVYGLFPQEGDERLFPKATLDVCQQLGKIIREYELETGRKPRHGNLAVGCDPAEGGNATVWTVVGRYGVVYKFRKQTKNTAEIGGITIKLMRRFKISPWAVAFDSGGGGKQIADHLRDIGYEGIMDVQFGASSNDPKAYKSMRAEIYGELAKAMKPSAKTLLMLATPPRKWLRNWNGFALPPDDGMLREDLTVLPKLWDGEGRLRLPPKDRAGKQRHSDSGERTIKEMLGGRSPDDGDSLALGRYAWTMAEDYRAAATVDRDLTYGE